MKKKLIIIIFVIIIGEMLAISATIIYLLSTPASSDSQIEAYKEDKLKNNSVYNIKADIGVSKDIVTVQQEISLKMAEKKVYIYIPSVTAAATDIKRVYAEGGVKSYRLKDTVLEVELNFPLDSLTIDYTIHLDNTTGTLSHTADTYYLTNFLATPAVYKGGSPIQTYKSAFGDPYIYEMNSYYVMFETDKNLNIYAPGEKEEHVFGANKITIFEASNQRDFPAVLSKNAQVYKEKHKDITIYYIDSYTTKEYINYALDFAIDKIGPYPYKSFFVVKAPISQNGMEFSGMIYLSDKCFANQENLKRVAYHEVLHQWFYGIIGSDQLNEPFFDEGLVNYLSLTLCNTKPRENFNNTFINMRLRDYTSRNQYYELAYNDSAAYFGTINKKLGNNFYKLLHKVYEVKKFKIIYFDEFKKYVSEF